MKNITKWAIGALTTASLLAGVFLSSKSEDKEERINFQNPQKTLDEAFTTSGAKHISQVIYDPDFTQSDAYLREIWKDFADKDRIEEIVRANRETTRGRYFTIEDISSLTGDGKKRPVFARKELLTSPVNLKSDLENMIYHEDVHAQEKMNGYRMGDTFVKGENVSIMFNSGEARPHAISMIEELDAYASELERANKSEKKYSTPYLRNLKTQLSKVYLIVENALLKEEELTLTERKYAEEKMQRHAKTIETLKKRN